MTASPPGWWREYSRYLKSDEAVHRVVTVAKEELFVDGQDLAITADLQFTHKQ